MQEFSFEEVRRVFEGTFPLIEDYHTFISEGLDPGRYRGGYRTCTDPHTPATTEAAWTEIQEQLASFQQMAMELEGYAPIKPEQDTLHGTFEVSAEGQALRLCPQ